MSIVNPLWLALFSVDFTALGVHEIEEEISKALNRLCPLHCLGSGPPGAMTTTEDVDVV